MAALHGGVLASSAAACTARRWFAFTPPLPFTMPCARRAGSGCSRSWTTVASTCSLPEPTPPLLWSPCAEVGLDSIQCGVGVGARRNHLQTLVRRSFPHRFDHFLSPDGLVGGNRSKALDPCDAHAGSGVDARGWAGIQRGRGSSCYAASALQPRRLARIRPGGQHLPLHRDSPLCCSSTRVMELFDPVTEALLLIGRASRNHLK